MRAPRWLILLAVALFATVGVAVVRVRTLLKKPIAPAASSTAAQTSAPQGDAGVDVQETTSDAGTDAAGGYTVDDDDYPFADDFGEGDASVADATHPAIDPDQLVKLIPLMKRDEWTISEAKLLLGPRNNHGNQGNPEIASHEITRTQCKERLKGVVLQTKEQREICGAPWEVPIHTGDPRKATVCIDQFEYPNRPCVLPFVYNYPIQATHLCALAGKRLCTQEEWQVACEAGPNGEPPRQYAYGDELDLEICHTGRQKAPKCDVDTAIWKTCSTNTVPSGSYPKCKSRLGVYDQHGNVAEGMTRMENGVKYVQLKGSAFFYDGKMYKDHCRFDPRWHVDPVMESWHTNYHLGFRCCRTIMPLADRVGDAGTTPLMAPQDAGVDAEPLEAAAPVDADDDPIEYAEDAP